MSNRAQETSSTEEIVSGVNNIINEWVCSLSPAIECSNPGDLLRLDRLRNKWFDPNDAAAKAVELRDVALRGFINHLSVPSPMRQTLASYEQRWSQNFGTAAEQEIGRVLCRTRALLRDWLADFQIKDSLDQSYTGPGMNTQHTGGTDEISKLVYSEAWPCQPNARPILRRVAIRHPILRRRCKHHGHAIWRRSQGVSSPGGGKPPSGEFFQMGFDLLTANIRHDTDRITTVPKNNKTDRVIAMALIGDQIAESAVAFGIEECLENAGCFLRESSTGFDGQHYHRQLLQYEHLATVDFSAASDSVYSTVAEYLLRDTPLLKPLLAVRVRNVEIEDVTYAVPMIATMGRRICFTTMTLLLAALACAVCGYSTVDRLDCNSPQVYGDDVIIPNIHARLFIEVAELLGFKPNLGKTFVYSAFRESCGGFFYDGIGYLRSFEMKPAENLPEAISLANKTLLNFMESIDASSKDFWWSLHERLFSILRDFRGPLPAMPEVELGSWCFDPSYTEEPSCNTQVRYLSDLLQVERLFVVRSVREKVSPLGRSPSRNFYSVFLAVRDGVRPSCFKEKMFVDERIIVDEHGLRYGTLENLRNYRSRNIRLRRMDELTRFLQCLGGGESVAWFSNHGSYELYRVRSFITRDLTTLLF